ncbi:MAG: VWA domain-containing protein [Acidobacteriota bacterium]
MNLEKRVSGNRCDRLFNQLTLQRGARILAALVIPAFLLAIAGLLTAPAQEVADTLRINTRVVFMDALVKDKRTSSPISDLKLDSFEIFDDGKPRPISYFTAQGQARKPLALVLILDLRKDGAGRFLKRPEILKTMLDELAKLPPEDEVGIMAMDINGEDETRLWLCDFTRDPVKLAAAFEKVPGFVDVSPEEVDAHAKKEAEKAASQSNGSLTLGRDSSTAKDSGETQPRTTTKDAAKPDDAVQVEVVKGKNGATITRTTRKDGSIDVKRQNKKGNVTIELNDVYDMAAATRDAIHKAEEQRPNSQTSVVWISDGIAPIFFEDRDATEQLLIRHNVIFNSLTVELRTLFKLLMPIGKPIAGWMGISVYGSAKKLAQQSGGEAVKVSRVKDYGAGLSKIIGNLTARYTLGFTLAEDEKDDGRLHNLEVRVKAQDAKGKTRRLLVSSRRGYYLSEAAAKETTAKTQ